MDGSIQIVKEPESKRSGTPPGIQLGIANEVRLRLLSLLEFVSRSGAKKNGGADRDRTGDPLLAKQVLSQLSYSPVLESPTRKAGIGAGLPQQSCGGRLDTPLHDSGGSGKTRTSDLTLIRGAL